MSEAPQPEIRFDDTAAFYAWAERQGGKWERQDGVVVKVMAPERVNHSRIKFNVCRALADALNKAGLPCEAFVDGPTVHVAEGVDYVPDVVASCAPVDGRGMTVPDPVIVVEVLSPSTQDTDIGNKLEGYFRLPSVQHYLVFASDKVRAIHHRRWTEGRLLTSIAHDGPIELDPPGVSIAVEECYRGTGLPGAL